MSLFETAVADFYENFPARRADVDFVPLSDHSFSNDADCTNSFAMAVIKSVSRAPQAISVIAEQAFREHAPAIYRSNWYHGKQDGPDRCAILVPPETFDNRPYGSYLLVDHFNCHAQGAQQSLPTAHVPATVSYQNSEFWWWKVFDHEAGHALFSHEPISWRANLPAAMDVLRHIDECYADAWAAGAHIRRFGSDTGFLPVAARERARLIPFMNGRYAAGHMTAATLLAVDAARHDFNALAAPAAQRLVREIVEATHLDAGQLQRAANASAVAGLSLTCGYEAFLDWFAESRIFAQALTPALHDVYLDSAADFHGARPGSRPAAAPA